MAFTVVNRRVQGAKLKHRIGLAYLPGALPCFEAFGNLPTDLIGENGLVGGEPASEVLDMIIIPGGSLVESQTVKDGIAKEILKMAKAGKFVLGICSGFQILSRGTDIGRLSPTPIFREGMGLLDVKFKPMICTDQVKVKVVGSSLLTDEVGAAVAGFHCHTYGDITLYGKAKPILVSGAKRLNYFRNPKDIVSGACNLEGNVVGVLTHALLDQNPVIIRGITKSLDISVAELEEIREANAKLKQQMKQEVGILTGVHPRSKTAPKEKHPRTLLITALESGGGKTVIVTGFAGALKKRGWNVGVIKIGGDIRDIVPALYLTKEPMQGYSSIEVADTGWQSVSQAVKGAEKDYDFVLVEGAMNAFTGLLLDEPRRPNSTAEVAAALGSPTVVVAGCDKEGIEGGIVSALNYVHFLKKLGIKTAGVILNKVYLNYMSEETRVVVKQAFERAGTEVLGIVPVSDLEGRGAIPEVEIKYEEFTAKAVELVEQWVNIDRVVEVAAPFVMTELDYETFVAKFKDAL
jgi:cobyric acid synthase